jgi:hypothetical protein
MTSALEGSLGNSLSLWEHPGERADQGGSICSSAGIASRTRAYRRHTKTGMHTQHFAEPLRNKVDIQRKPGHCGSHSNWANLGPYMPSAGEWVGGDAQGSRVGGVT